MTEQSIDSDDMTLKRAFQDFYRVPDYQREYVWGEPNVKGKGGDEVEQFLGDIHAEFEDRLASGAPEYFIGTIVVCEGEGEVLDLIDGQQRMTTALLMLCAIRDRFIQLGVTPPADLDDQIASSSTDWQGNTVDRIRLELQYPDSEGVLETYAKGHSEDARKSGTRSIQNLAVAYQTTHEFLESQFRDDPEALRRFYGYFTNKVKLIRIRTPSVASALKIFETINDRGVGLDAMDLLKNLLFRNAGADQFVQLKEIWKELVDVVHDSGEKPLRFLRQYLLADYGVDQRLREDGIYDWFVRNEAEVAFESEPLAFAKRLLAAANALRGFIQGTNCEGKPEQGIINARYVGGKAARQHHVLLLAGRHLPPELFTRLCDEIETLLFAYLVTFTPANEYERAIVQGARQLKRVKTNGDYDKFESDFIREEKRKLAAKFVETLRRLKAYDIRAYRVRYILAKLAQYIDTLAYGFGGAHGSLSHYIEGAFDIEHILPQEPSEEALAEFGEASVEFDTIQRLGNLLLLERSINRHLGNVRYSEKAPRYAQSQILLAKCQVECRPVGRNDQITRAMAKIQSFPQWNAQAVEERQEYLANLACEVWRMPNPSLH